MPISHGRLCKRKAGSRYRLLPATGHPRQCGVDCQVCFTLIPLTIVSLAVARIFGVLAVVAMLLLALNFVAGLWIGDFNTLARTADGALQEYAMLRNDPDPDQARLKAAEAKVTKAQGELATPHARMVVHRLLGTASALVALLVASITITYFIGTSRWCKEVAETYKLPEELAIRSTLLKRRTFPWAMLSIVTVIGLVGLGAASDPRGANREYSASLVTPHYLAAMAGIVIIGYAFWVQAQRIGENYAIIDEILDNVRRIRAERGLPTERET